MAQLCVVLLCMHLCTYVMQAYFWSKLNVKA